MNRFKGEDRTHWMVDLILNLAAAMLVFWIAISGMRVFGDHQPTALSFRTEKQMDSAQFAGVSVVGLHVVRAERGDK